MVWGQGVQSQHGCALCSVFLVAGGRPSPQLFRWPFSPGLYPRAHRKKPGRLRSSSC